MAKKRTAYRTVIACLALNGVRITHDTEDADNRIIALAQGPIGDDNLAAWLRTKADT